MSGTQRRPAFASYRDTVVEQIKAGDPAEQQLAARSHLAAFQ